MIYCPQTGAIQYHTPSAAWRVVQKQRLPTVRKHHKHRPQKKIHVHRCPHCGAWHLGNLKRLTTTLRETPA